MAIVWPGGWVYRWVQRKSLSADEVWAQAQEDLLADRLDRVDQAVARLGRLRDPTPLDWFLRAQVAIARHRPDEAVADLARVPDSHDMAARARLLAGQVELRRDRFRFGEGALRAAIVLDPALVQAHRELIFIYGSQLRRAELHAEFLALSSLQHLTFKEVFDWCLLQTDSWEPSEAAGILERCVIVDPDDRWSRVALAENYRRMGRLDEAESIVRVLAEDDPEALAARARIAFDRNEEDVAERLLGTGPVDHPALARLRGRLALARRDGRAALHHFQFANAADPNAREALPEVIAALVMIGDQEAAAPLRETAARREKLGALIQRAAIPGAENDLALHRQLGDACEGLHHDAQARAWYNLVITRNPLDTDAQRALFRLRDVDRSPTSSTSDSN
jgi:tetratricopeptide (TPR) repeat protein